MTRDNPFKKETDDSLKVWGGSAAERVNKFHHDDDLDSSGVAHHHTLGEGPNQAAPGSRFKQLLDDFAAHLVVYAARVSAVNFNFLIVNNAISALENKVEALEDVAKGQVSLAGTSVAAGSSVNVVVPFGKTFSVAPLVFVSMAGAPGGSNRLVPRVSGVTTTQFTFYLFNAGSVSATWSAFPTNWKAELP